MAPLKEWVLLTADLPLQPCVLSLNMPFRVVGDDGPCGRGTLVLSFNVLTETTLPSMLWGAERTMYRVELGARPFFFFNHNELWAPSRKELSSIKTSVRKTLPLSVS